MDVREAEKESNGFGVFLAGNKFEIYLERHEVRKLHSDLESIISKWNALQQQDSADKDCEYCKAYRDRDKYYCPWCLKKFNR